ADTPSEKLKPENVYLAGMMPGPKEPTALQLNYLLMPLIKELKELWQGYHFWPTSTGPSKSFICVAILTAIAAINIARSWTVSTDDANAFSKHWKKFCLSNQNLFPKQKIKPNHHFADHIPELFQRWGPAQA
ncbi:hypothetical protein O181_123410, partial [Austropuccinia psidii MF-1]|nr:hypothetical protein [Austropuccinia psidii MF-1]